MSVTEVQRTAEAVCGALYRLDWNYLGDEAGSSWFIRGEKPRQVRVEVQRSKLAPVVLVNIEWFNLSSLSLKRGRQSLQIGCSAGTESERFEAAEQAVRRCLTIFSDVISGQGVASSEAVDDSTGP